MSNGSPTLERTDARVVSSSSDHHHHPPKPSFCRNLFGPVDHDELQRDLKVHLREMQEVAAAKWEFDFVRHTPLPTCGGRLQWEAVDRKDLPEFYSTTSSRSSPSTGNNNNNNSSSRGSSVDLNGNHHHHHSCAAGGGQGAGNGRQPPAGGAAGAVVAAAVDDGGERCEGQQVDCSEQCRHGQRKRPAACQGG
ncbi:hypothetical protein CRUP_038691 [Coryphaenoides rupestris]|nr:hypothetical protein CRUP_038691 [Coryphaenoides rupestris]